MGYKRLYILRNYFDLKGKKIGSTKRIGPHSIDVLNIIMGSLLGDSHIEKRNNGVRIKFTQ